MDDAGFLVRKDLENMVLMLQKLTLCRMLGANSISLKAVFLRIKILDWFPAWCSGFAVGVVGSS